MKKLLFLVICVTALVGCKSNEDKAKKLIDTELFKTLYDYNSYEPIEFSRIDSVNTSIYLDSTIRSYVIKILALQISSNQYLAEIQEEISNALLWSSSSSAYGKFRFSEAKDRGLKASTKASEYLNLIRANVDTLTSLIKNFKSTFEGYKMSHKFRCKTKGGGSEIANYEYYFDPKFIQIIREINVDDEENDKIIKAIESFEKEVTSSSDMMN